MELLHSLDSSGQIALMVVAVALGAFVGLRREMELQEQGVPGLVGFRTMPMVVLLGCVSTFFPTLPFVPVLAFVAICTFLLIAYYNGVFQLQFLGLTSELSTIIMFVVGLLVGYGHIPQAVVLTIFVSTFSAFKKGMHGFARSVSPAEWSGAFELLIISVLVLPLLPREAIDPWGVIVLYDLWLIVIFISAIGFTGYFFTKYLGHKKSTILTALVGSLVSSTVVTTHIARAARDANREEQKILFIGMLVSIATMLARVGFVIFILVSTDYVLRLLTIPAAMLIVLAGVAVGSWWYMKPGETEAAAEEEREIPPLQSPFNLRPALEFAFLLALVLILTNLGLHYLGSWGVFATSFLSAMVDVDATVVSSLHSLKQGTLETGMVSVALLIALSVNTLIKALYVWIISRQVGFTLAVLALTGLLTVVGIITYFIF